jgi:hypothetical protein
MPSDVPAVAPGQSILVVEVRDQRHGAIHYWSLHKLQARELIYYRKKNFIENLYVETEFDILNFT